ncbi:MAG TPA: PmoA family protein [Acidimicrobiales bacterium]|nr:PmoA family protein [Acidimicrobiales bacterium]
MSTSDPTGQHWTYVGNHRKKPHVHPLATPSGKVLTRSEPEDHPWHRALWFTIKYVNEENFWEEAPPYGVLRHVDDETIHWIRPDRETVGITETRRLTSTDLGDGAYALDWDTTLVPATDVVLDRTEFTTWGGYGGLSLRGRADWTDTRLLADDGSTHERQIGVPGRWLDLTGTVEGGTAGVAFLDHPTNPRHPVPWYASTRAATYGDEGWANFVNAAFLFHEAMEVAGGEPLRFRYRVVVHDGDADAGAVERWWSAWVDGGG